ncbi:FecR family protein [Blastopirellula sp. J2-11]|uniref:FecR family protein n=1 Tax=Blastopirellula sp. J2-11 TaxID=2943192 RepID=UPI0021CA4087|nr:FecR family protein [Blastopirellula sp. J2-11]UUO07026.1 FecR family protein [Blastopirellula sp. J2-11]
MIHGRNFNFNMSWEDDFSEREFHRLVGKLLEGEISDQEFERLQTQLSKSETLRNSYMQLAELHVSLSDTFADVVRPAAREVAEAHSMPPQRRPLALVAVLCALLLIACWFYFPAANSTPIAWTGFQASAGRELRSGDRLVATAKEGSIIFRNGVRVSLSKGADLELLAPKLVRLHTGQAHVDVGEQGKGFTVLTEAVDVIDLGTVFGVSANSHGETDVLVFDGVVDIASNKLPKSAREMLVSGQAQRYRKSGGDERISTVWSSTSPPEWSTVSRGGNSLIASVADNVSSDSDAKFYMVVPGGFREDAKVYADRNHEWNGLGETKIPSELIGADYIRTFNDDKNRKDIQITMTLSRPADVYVLVDERYLVPEWLANDFVDTGWQVGIDLGDKYQQRDILVPPLGTADIRWLGKGAGRSVDVPVNVWKRKDIADLSIHLGANGEKSDQFDGATELAGSMYGIVVVPKNRLDD